MKHSGANTALDAPLLFFLLAALLGVWYAYDRAAALASWVVLFAAVVAYVLLTWHVRKSPRAELLLPPPFMQVLVVCGVVANGLWMLAFPFLLHNANAHRLAAVTEISLPLAVALIFHFARRHHMWHALAMLFLAGILIAGLVLANAFSTLFCLGIVGSLAAGIVLLSHSRVGCFTRAPRMQTVLVVVSIALGGLVYFHRTEFAAVGTRVLLFFSQDDFPRSELYANVLYLLRDYVFTGSGPGTFPMVYAIYGQLLHVYYLPHAHNMFLQVWVENGLGGLLAWVWLIVAFYARMWQQRAQWNWLAAGAVASVSVMLLHGLWDAPLYYAGWTPVLLFVPMGMAIGAIPPVPPARPHHRKRNALLALAALIAVGAIGLSYRSTIGGMWFANLGSLAQTQIELGAYAFPARAIPMVRRTTDESSARALFETAVQWDPGNVTALQRLGMLAFARGEYDKAQEYLANALTNAPDDWRTWQLLGDVYLAQGRDEDAFALWSRVRDAPSKLEVEATLLYDRAGDPVRAARARALARRIRMQIKLR